MVFPKLKRAQQAHADTQRELLQQSQMTVRLHHKVGIKALGNLALLGPDPSNLARV